MAIKLALKACQVCGSSIEVYPSDEEVSCPACGAEYDVLIHGVKSPTVQVVGLSPPITETMFAAFDVNPKSGRPPFIVTIEGSLTDVYGNPLAGKTINIYRNGVFLKSKSTGYAGYAGYFKTDDTVMYVGTYDYYAEFPGDDVYASSKSWAVRVVASVGVATALTIAASPTSERVPFTTTIYGRLTRTDTGVGLAGKNVRLYEGLVYVGVTLTDSAGNYSFKYDVKVARDYEFYTEFIGDEEFIGSTSPTITVKGIGLVATGLSIMAEPTKGTIPFTTTVSGVLTRLDTGAGVGYKGIRLMWKKPGEAAFSLYGVVSSNSKGGYKFTPKIDVADTYEFYAEFLGDSEFAGCDSPSASVSAAVAVPTYEVTVKDWVTKKPIAEAEVTVVDVGTFTADVNGVATVLAAAGTYTVTVSKSGYKPATKVMTFPGVNQVGLIPLWAIGAGIVAAAVTTVAVAKAVKK